MSTSRIYILIISLAFLLPNAHGAINEDSLYKVLKIKTKREYYIIQAKRNDSLFKIFSKKGLPGIMRDLEKIKKGKRYYFDFSREGNDTVKYGPPLAGLASHLHVKMSRFFMVGNSRFRLRKRFHYRIYGTRNLIGLYYSRERGQAR